jgi:glutamyl-tRNA synthetase
LLWTNQQHLLRAPAARLVEELTVQLRARGLDPGRRDVAAIVAVQRERAKTLAEMAENSVFFFVAPARYDAKAAAKSLTPQTAAVLVAARETLGALGEWTAGAIHAALQLLGDQRSLALGKIAQPLRVAVCGGGVSPPIDQTLAILGREEVLARIAAAEAFIRSQPPSR